MATRGVSTLIAIPTMEGELVVELYTQHCPRACAYFCDLVLGASARQLRFSERDAHRAVASLKPDAAGGATDAMGAGGTAMSFASLSAAGADRSLYFGDELSDALRFVGAGLVGVPCEPAPRAAAVGAFFVTLAPCEHLGRSAVVVGRVVRGMGAVVGALARARCEGTRLLSPMEVLRAARRFEEPTPARPTAVSAATASAASASGSAVAAGAKPRSRLLDSMFD